MTDLDVRPRTADPEPDDAALPARRPAGTLRYLQWGGVYVALQSLFLLLLVRLSPRFFYVDDQQAQYLPAFHWFGRHLTGGRPPLMAPDLGAGGNFTADPQYGALDPAHWLISAVVASFGNVNTAALVLGGTPVLLLGLGVVTLLLGYRCPPALALAAGLGVASTGMSLWWGSSWWPMAWVTAWLPWFWFGLASRHRFGVLVVGVSAWLIAAGGYPYGLLFVLATFVPQVVERVRAGGWRALAAREFVSRIVAGAAGLAVALPGLLTALEMGPYTTRETVESLLGNGGVFIPNLADVLLGSSTLTPAVSGFYEGPMVLAPVASMAVFILPALAFVRWRDVVGRPGMVTALTVVVVAVAATQLPTNVGAFRFPWRFLTEAQVYLGVLAALGLAHGRVVTRGRVGWAVALLVAQLALAAARAPVQTWWHLAGLGLGLLAVAALVLGRSGARRAVASGAAIALVATSLLGAVLTERASTALNARDQERRGQPLTDEPARSMPTRPAYGTRIAEYQGQAAPLRGNPTVFTWDPELIEPPQGWGTGALAGNTNLLADVQPGYGYHAAGNKAWSYYGCVLHLGNYNPFQPCVDRFFEPVPGFPGTIWLDLMTSDRVLLSPLAPERVLEHFEQDWDDQGRRGVFRSFARDDGLPGRVTATRGEVTASADAQPPTGPTAVDGYTVTTGAAGGELVLRIPWWPGLEATAGGQAVEVGSIDETLTVVRLPPGLQAADLSIVFRPVGERILVPALVVGAVLLVVAVAAGGPSRRARKTQGA